MDNEIRCGFNRALLVTSSLSIVTYLSSWQNRTGVRLDSRSKLDVFLVESCLLMVDDVKASRLILRKSIKSVREQKINNNMKMQTNHKEKAC